MSEHDHPDPTERTVDFDDLAAEYREALEELLDSDRADVRALARAILNRGDAE